MIPYPHGKSYFYFIWEHAPNMISHSHCPSYKQHFLHF